ncbi:putative secreted RxLR effector protein [Phytophthora cinnamomi]|uniref:putative secreted RxLR effector protein n=1 Tax=Phytophthora cinnamomi TaxID=4785 RepID=UPI002B2E73DF|nr:putative secreted RxLR effector protein [Phytophthora cinnamomi]QVE55535.1 RxLR effector protein 23c [Phytophthora cinnamomi]
MRLQFVLLVAAAAFVGGSHAALTTNGIATSQLAALDSLSDPVHQGRFLRINADKDEEERGINPEVESWFANILAKWKGWVPNLEELPTHLKIEELNSLESKLAGASKTQLKSLESLGYKPETLYQKLDIGEKINTKTRAELDDDIDFKLYVAFKEYWANRSWLRVWLHSK